MPAPAGAQLYGVVTKIRFDVFEHGIIRRRVLEGFTEKDEDWAVGHPMPVPQRPARRQRNAGDDAVARPGR